MDERAEAALTALSNNGDLYAATLVRLLARARGTTRQALARGDDRAADHWAAQVVDMEELAAAHVAYREGRDDAWDKAL